MSGTKKRWPAPSATPWDGLDPKDLSAQQRIVMESHRSIYGFRHDSYQGDIDFLNSYIRTKCPRCDSTSICFNGKYKNGLTRCACKDCGKTFGPTTGTIFEDKKLPIPAWVDFLLQALSFESLSSMIREDRRAVTTTPYWMEKIFLVLKDIQTHVVLSGEVQIDETYYPVPQKDERLTPNGKKLRGLSRNKLCIAIGCDTNHRSVFIYEGHGKTNRKRTWNALGNHIAEKSKLIHDMEHAHDILVERLSLESEAHNSKLISKLDDSKNPLCEVNHLCFLLKQFLHMHSGFNRNNLQDYLNLFFVAMNPPYHKMEKVAMILDLAMQKQVTYRYRDYASRFMI
ncbi:MAG: IS1595 family transposase [Coriobacteriales bacterium]|nr:IS1595 family transposase [Coriobacteriales bacterium]